MKKIKFRGLAIEDYTGKPITEKKFVYGNVWANEDNSYVIIGEYKDKKGCCYNYKVDPDSVAQFVGYDAEDKEVYEGDKVHGINGTMVGHTFTARLANVAQSTNGMYWGFLPEDVRKERGENENFS